MIKDDKDNYLTELKDLKGRFISFDTETTGLNYSRDHIISIAGVEIIDGCLTGRQFQGFIEPRVIINSEAIKVHKMDNNYYKEYHKNTYQSDYQVIKNFMEFVGDSVLIAYNANFDYNFLHRELAHWKLPNVNKDKFFCSMKLFKNIFGEIDPSLKKGITLSKCCDYLGIKSAHQNYHSALYDAYICARLTCGLFDFIQKKKKSSGNRKIKEIKEKSINDKSSELLYNNVEQINSILENIDNNIKDYYSEEKQNLNPFSKDINQEANESSTKVFDHSKIQNERIELNNLVSTDNQLDELDHYKSIMEDYVAYTSSTVKKMTSRQNIQIDIGKSFISLESFQLKQSDIELILNDD
jgi:DNA polymerase-3 subunit epsilon